MIAVTRNSEKQSRQKTGDLISLSDHEQQYGLQGHHHKKLPGSSAG
jgi:hypothetical protein